MRQLRGMLKSMNDARMTEFHDRVASMCVATRNEIPTKEELFGLSSEETPSAFDRPTDDFLMQKAKELLEERRKAADGSGEQ